jgi:dTDP-4-amino-4,6-dideoxygalactose transaminase
MDPIMLLAQRHRLWVIEDCAQAHGARYRGRPVGTIGHIGAYSFCQDKVMTTGGEGGMLVTADAAVRARAWSFKDHGKNEATVRAPRHGQYGFLPVHDSFGTNWRMTEMQAAIGREQLRKLDDWVARRRRNATRLAKHLKANPAIDIPMPPKGVEHSFYKLYVLVRPDRLRDGWDRDRLLREINAAGVPCFTGASPEIHLDRAFLDAGLAPGRPCDMARVLGQRSLMFQVHPTLRDRHIDWVGSTVRGVLDRAAK